MSELGARCPFWIGERCAVEVVISLAEIRGAARVETTTGSSGLSRVLFLGGMDSDGSKDAAVPGGVVRAGPSFDRCQGPPAIWIDASSSEEVSKVLTIGRFSSLPEAEDEVEYEP